MFSSQRSLPCSILMRNPQTFPIPSFYFIIFIINFSICNDFFSSVYLYNVISTFHNVRSLRSLSIWFMMIYIWNRTEHREIFQQISCDWFMNDFVLNSVLVLFDKDVFIILKTERRRNRKIDLPLSGSLPMWPQQQRLAQAGNSGLTSCIVVRGLGT